MPWDETASGFTKHTKSGKGGGFVRNPKQYETLRRKGMSRQRAAAITNSDNVSKALPDLARSAGREAARFVGGARRGIKMAGQGHTPLGQIGSGVAGKPTYTIRPGMSRARQAGVHAGVVAGNAPTLMAGATVGAAAEHKVSKAFGVEIEKSAKVAAGVTTALVGATAAAKEGARRHYNKKGAAISVGDSYRHPYRSGYAQSAAAQRTRAGRLQAKADATGSKRAARAANVSRWASGVNAEAAQMGGMRQIRQKGFKHTVYNKKRDANAKAPVGPIGIGKSAFGVEL